MPDHATTLPKVLVVHPWMGRGGSEAVAMWALQALQGRAEVTFMTASAMNWDALNAAYGTSVDPRRIRLLRTTKLPGVRSGAQFVHWQRAYFERQCRRASRGFDVCVSAYNPIDFGRPGIQLLGDFSFSESMRRRLYDANDEPFYHRQSLIRRLYLATGECLRGLGRPALAERGDLAVANSEWSANLLAKYFGVLDAPVLYPPVTLSGPGKTDAPAPAAGAPVERGPFAFACLGRIAPEKEIETVIAILDRVRNAGYPVTLDVIGQFDGGAYSDQIRRLTEARKDWIRTPGFLNSEEKNPCCARHPSAFTPAGSRPSASPWPRWPPPAACRWCPGRAARARSSAAGSFSSAASARAPRRSSRFWRIPGGFASCGGN